ncbi:2-ketogluconate reductase [Paraburkholderia domus]|uniref:2-ketogluconate reductase n=1 Tax=Paraburkholderia domus TaxID=2793075 RepID=A0A9N8QW16_9BURK|nr:2-hydroxyacid dehydrogenase [Paraburkholderia domus]MBK5063656.1 2-hydroxyacid dehydrogenase [Burkholderia sp. R-70199]MBK5089677.1 2-hydroxyacid dehydrogenase [Burkholderia sp. R-69927]MBK5122858.1 2-hydroxyacid dehydrogenase [Burkholderia sp. R-69980]MBK5165274.1 2-hydroxyacid dehydrogenase [Burkholderia sp. R-70211]MBK5182730.1 2-hydroxyacid dehydrogenase [Burkholderia sp. R-69749]MCI0148984.1 2-hydroxyacid dehydrogenase [Paraburkholderia sediminicola]
MKPSLLVLIPLKDASRAGVEAAFDVVYAPDATQRAAAIAAHGETIRAVLTNGTTGLTAAEIDRMPQLEFVSALGAGYENLAIDHARSRGIVLVNGAGTNDHCVADHAFALLLAVVRDVPQLDQGTREGVWRDTLPLRPSVSGKRLGIVGLGNIGEKIARRGAGFDMEIGYHNRKPREGSSLRYFDSVQGLAQWCDFLVVATPGGAGTRHLIGAEVLEALGSGGFVVNVSRGSVVDTAALAQALAAGAIAGAGLDVYEGEPHPPEALLTLRNVVLTPHVGGRSPEAIAASVDNFLANAERHFAGEAVLTPI